MFFTLNFFFKYRLWCVFLLNDWFFNFKLLIVIEFHCLNISRWILNGSWLNRSEIISNTWLINCMMVIDLSSHIFWWIKFFYHFTLININENLLESIILIFYVFNFFYLFIYLFLIVLNTLTNFISNRMFF